MHRFDVSARLGARLSFEARRLINRVIQLVEAVGDLPTGDEQLEAVSDLGVGVVPARERRDLNGEVRHERGVNQRFLYVDVKNLLPPLSERRGQVLCLPRRVLELVRGFNRGKRPSVRLVDAQRARDQLRVPSAPKRAGEVDAVRAVGDHRRLEQLGDQAGDHRLGELDQALPGLPRLVELEHGELGVVRLIDAFVAEVSVDLEHALHAADHEPLQVQLGRHAEVELQVQRVVVGDERARGGAARDHVHHRGLDLDERAVLKKPTDIADDTGPLQEHIAAVVVHEQIDVALALARLGVGHAVKLVGERAHALRGEAQLPHVHGELTGAGAHQAASNPDNVAQIELFPDGERVIPDVVALHVDLHAVGTIKHAAKAGFAHLVLEHQAAAKNEVPPQRGKVDQDVRRKPLLFARAQLKISHTRPQFSRGMSDGQSGRIRGDAFGSERLGLGDSGGVELVHGGRLARRGRASHPVSREIRRARAASSPYVRGTSKVSYTNAKSF